MPVQTMQPRFDVPTTILHGGGCRRQLPDLVRQVGGSRVLLVTDPGVVGLGIAEDVTQLLVDADIEVSLFDGVQADPSVDNVAEGVAVLEYQQADCVVGLGGGSPIDAAKVIAARSANPQPLHEYMGLHKIANPGLPLIAIPTTAGTGSEATKVAVITDTSRNVKMMMLSTPLLPRAAIVDYELSMSMPPGLTAAVGVDTLTHGIEAYVSLRANSLTDPLALKCIELCALYLRTAWESPQDVEARAGMMLAATLGGMAFSNSSVCLVHGMSRPVGAIFHLPHGLSNAVLLPTVTQFSIGSAQARYGAISRLVGSASDGVDEETACKQLVQWLVQLNASLRLPRLSECKSVERSTFDSHVEQMAKDAIASGSPANNPRIPSEDEIVRLYHEAW